MKKTSILRARSFQNGSIQLTNTPTQSTNNLITIENI